jgi:hypothetical protein
MQKGHFSPWEDIGSHMGGLLHLQWDAHLSGLASADIALKDQQVVLVGQLCGRLVEGLHWRCGIGPCERQPHVRCQAARAQRCSQYRIWPPCHQGQTVTCLAGHGTW